MTTVLAALGDMAGEIGWHAWQASMAGLVALAVAAWLRRRSPRAAAIVVSLALIKFVLPPVIRFPLALGDAAAVWTNPFALVPSGQESEGAALAVLVSITVASLGISSLLAAGIVRHALRVRTIRDDAVMATEGEAFDALGRTSRRMGLKAAPALLISEAAEGPFATGVCRPAIVLPRALADRLDGESLEIVLAHELAHHRRRDLPMAWCAAAATVLFWFTPIAKWLSRMLQELREECCDEAVVRLGFAPGAAYAQVLLNSASIQAGVAAMPMSDEHPLARRLRRLLAPAPALPLQVTAIVISLFALLCVAVSPFPSPWGAGGDRIVRVHRVVR